MVAAMPLHIVHHPDYDANLPADHRFPMGKYLALMAALRGRGLIVPETLHQPATLPASQLALAHDPAYVAQVIACTVPPAIEREIGFADRRSRLAPRAAGRRQERCSRHGWRCEHGIACNTAGGSHHARRAQGAGFCTLNDVGVAGSVLLAERRGRAHPGRRPRRAPGRRHRRHLSRRAARLHLLDACRAQFSGAQDRLQPGHRAARQDRRRGLSRAAAGRAAGARTPRQARHRLLQCRRRSACRATGSAGWRSAATA